MVTEVRVSEGTTALLLSFNAFLVLAAYACIKPVREALILEIPGGSEYKIYMAGATAAVMLIAVPAYARVAVGLPRNRLIIGVTCFFAANLALFYIFGSFRGSSTFLALAFYLWIGVFNMMTVAQFWSFSNDIYSEASGERLFPLLGLGGSVGAAAGSALARVLIHPLGPLPLLLVALAILLLSVPVVQIVHTREVRQAEAGRISSDDNRPIGGSTADAFRLILQNRYLGFIALFSLLFTLVKTNGDYILANLVARAAHYSAAASSSGANAAEEYIGGFYADFNLYVDCLGLILQAVFVSRLIRYAGMRFAFFVLPVFALLNAGTMTVLPLLAVVRVGKIVESATDYSLNNTLRALLWLPTTRQAKYLAKQTVDSFFVRMGDVGSAAVVFLGVGLLGWKVRYIATCNVLLTLIWIWLAWLIMRETSEGGSNCAPQGTIP